MSLSHIRSAALSGISILKAKATGASNNILVWPLALLKLPRKGLSPTFRAYDSIILRHCLLNRVVVSM
jgi:hypothetical protein